MELVRKDFGSSELSSSHPLDLLYRVNSEIASLAYADKSGVMNPGVRPYVALFRKLQSDEKIALIEGMTRKYGFDAHITINRDTQNATTEREIIKSKNLVDLAKLKYDFGRAVVSDHIEGQKYLSDNELRAVRLESEAQVECVRLTETLRADTSRQLSRDKLEEIIRSSEMKYASLIRQAEIERGMNRDGNRKEIAMAYIREQAKINRAMIEFHIAEVQAKARIGEAYYKSMGEIEKEGIRFLQETGRNRFSFRGSGDIGELNIDIEVE